MGKKMTVTLHVGDALVEKITADKIDMMAYILSDVMSRYYARYPKYVQNIYDIQWCT